MTLVPRSVLVERPTEFRDLLARHGTREQARFFLAQRGRAIDDVEERHLRYEEVRARVIGAIPPTWRTATVQRDDLDRFLFAADDVVAFVENVAVAAAGGVLHTLLLFLVSLRGWPYDDYGYGRVL